jgi:2-methylcitrate dehydratase PrpD
VLEAEVANPRGHARNPMTEAEVRAKFADCAGPALGAARAARLAETIVAVERLANLRALTDLLAYADAGSNPGGAGSPR